jgi:hypothetical protein
MVWYGFLEKVYRRAMQVDPRSRGLKTEIEAKIKVWYKEKPVGVKVDPRGDGRRIGECASVVRRTQYTPTRRRGARAGIANGRIVKEGVRDSKDQSPVPACVSRARPPSLSSPKNASEFAIT